MNGMFHVEHWFGWLVRLGGWITVPRKTTFSSAPMSSHRGRCSTWNNASRNRRRSVRGPANGRPLFGYHAEGALSETRFG
jgi:hypothetical protein